MSELIGKRLGTYRIEERIGAGGMAAVYKAYHEAMDRYVAVKVLPEDVGADEERRLRFEREARVIASLEHAHILPVHDYGQADDRLYLVMRYVDTGTLKDRMDSGALSVDEINRVMQQVGTALEYAHQRGVIHRDIKPSNVLLDDQGDCYLTDFGLARMLSASIKITKSGVGMGTPAYMSPEQGQGQEVDVRSDIYSLGIMLYEMVTGRVPYEAEPPVAVLLEHITKPLPLPREVNPSVSLEVESVLLKALSKDPADRYQSVREMIDAFDVAVRSPQAGFLSDEPAPVTVPSLQPKGAASPSGRSRGKWWWIAAGAGVLLFVCVAVSALVLGQTLLKNWVPGAARGDEAIVTLVASPTATAVAKIAQATASRTPTAITRPEATPTAPPTVSPTLSLSSTPSPSPTITLTPLPPTPTVPPINLEVTPLTLLDSDPVRDIVWSPDGALLIVGTYHIRIYDAQTLDEVYVIDSVQWTSDIAVSGDGKMLAAASHDGVRIWEVGGWGEVLALSGSQGAESVAFSPDGRLVAAGVGSAVKIWELPDGRELQTLPGSSGRAVAFSPDGRLVAASGGVAGQEIVLWDVASGDELAPFTGHTNWVNSIDFSPDGRTLASGATDSTVRVWDVETRRQVRAFTAHTGQVESVAFAPDGRVLASASWDLTVKLWDTATGQALASLTGHTAWCQSVAFSPDGSTLASGANDQALRLWRVGTGDTSAGSTPTPTRAPAGPTPTPISLSERAISPANAAQVTQQALLESDWVKHIVWSPDGKWLAVVSYHVHIYDTETYAMVYTIDSVQWPRAAAFSPDSAVLALSVSDGVKRWAVGGWGELGTLAGSQDTEGIAFSPDGTLLATATGSAVKLWDVGSGQELRTIPAGGRATQVLFSPDGLSLIVGAGDEVRLLDVTTGQEQRALTGYVNTLNAVALSPDGRLLAACAVNNEIVRLWQVSDGRQVGVLPGHDLQVSSLGFSPNGQVLAVSSGIEVKLWDIAGGDELVTLSGHSDGVASLSFSPDGEWLATGGNDGTVRLWRVPE